MERDCNRCVYSTRDGNCRKWSCEGTETVNDIRAEVIEEVENLMKEFVNFENVDAFVGTLRKLKEQK